LNALPIERGERSGGEQRPLAFSFLFFYFFYFFSSSRFVFLNRQVAKHPLVPRLKEQLLARRLPNM
jgi:hypothetical protein